MWTSWPCATVTTLKSWERYVETTVDGTLTGTYVTEKNPPFTVVPDTGELPYGKCNDGGA